MKLFVYAFISLFVLVASAPVFAQKSDAEAKMIEQMPADEDGWAGADEDDMPADLDTPDADAAAQLEQNPQDALRAAKSPK